ncbi:MAG: hypothetical protein IKY20_00115 [Alistipes sp.]|nr:hypothetical protein [Alistipes sp.]
MATQFTPCPACGAVGEVGSNCQFCGTAIILKEGAILSDVRIVKQRTITPQQYAEKVSIYHNIVGLDSEISKVSIGEQEGIINLNGDLIYPLGNEPIHKFKDKVVRIGRNLLNLETFELVKEFHHNEFVLDKIKLLSDAISNNPSEDGIIDFGFTEDIDGLQIQNASTSYVDNIHNFTPQLMISFNAVSMESRDCAELMQRFSTCEDWKLFESISKDLHGNTIPVYDRHYYILCGRDSENCCNILLRILEQVYGILPQDAHNEMECSNGIFDKSNKANNYITKEGNSGCAGMLALILGISCTMGYGIVELIDRFIA